MYSVWGAVGGNISLATMYPHRLDAWQGLQIQLNKRILVNDGVHAMLQHTNLATDEEMVFGYSDIDNAYT